MDILSLPLSKLQTFVSAARCLSFTQAGRELFITQGAVSQQIIQLEKELGVKLFNRLHKKLTLTKEGKRLHKIVNETLSCLSEQIELIQTAENHEKIAISLAPAFATKWFIPRLEDLQTALGNIELQVSSEIKISKFNIEEVDVGIRYGLGNYPGLSVTRLMEIKIFPVCHPQLLREGPPLKSPEDLKHHNLLHYGTYYQGKKGTNVWDLWLEAAGAKNYDLNQDTWFNAGEMAIQAAINGKGITIGKSCLVQDDIKNELLVKPFDIELAIDESYYMVCPPDTAHLPKIQILRNWLLSHF